MSEKDKVIETRGLVKRFGAARALDGMDLEVRAGQVYAFLGRNGAGKTTALRLLLGMLRPDEGTMSVFGLDPLSRGEAVKQRMGFVSEDREFYPWMTVDETLRFAGAFYSNWDGAHVAELEAKMALPGEMKVGSLSRGLRGKLALVVALGHRPDLLLLDEPTSGLDAVVRREFLTETIDVLAEQECTILFSTHEIGEVEKVADTVGIIHQGKMLLAGSMEEVKGRYRRIRAAFPSDPPGELEGFALERLGNEVSFVVEGDGEESLEKVRSLGATQAEARGMDLEEIFCALTATP